MSRFLLVLGPSGAGKSTIIRALLAKDDRFRYIRPLVTRPLRPNEQDDKVPSSETEITTLEARGELVAVNRLYGVTYGTPRQPIVDALVSGQFPVIDWPVQQVPVMEAAFPNKLFRLYVAPPSIDVLRERLQQGERDFDGSREIAARQELTAYWSGRYRNFIDADIISVDGREEQTADSVFEMFMSYIEALNIQTALTTDSVPDRLTTQNPQISDLNVAEQPELFKLKSDKYRKARGGTARFLTIYCKACNNPILLYQKDGVGQVLRLYLNRIFAPDELSELQNTPSIREPRDMPPLVCSVCHAVIGAGICHSDGRLAYHLRQDMFYKRALGNVHPPVDE